MMLSRTRSAVGGKFLPYSVSNNCQEFISSLLASNNLATPTNTTFLKQATQSLIPSNVRKVSNTITDIAGGVDKIIQGGDIIKLTKKSNAWVQHVLKFASENNVNYIDALKNLECRNDYNQSTQVKPTNTEFEDSLSEEQKQKQNHNSKFMKHFEDQAKYKIEHNKEIEKYKAQDLKTFRAQQKLDEATNKKIDKHNKKYGLNNPKIDRKYIEKEFKKWGEFN
jgi:hypothetical protein